MHSTAPLSLISVAMANHSVVLEAPDEACGYLNGMGISRFGCLANTEKCAIYYPPSSTTATATTDTSLVAMITLAPQPSIICCEPSGGSCTVQPTACVDTIEDCTGICSNDPMTLKCTTGAQRHCNRAHFESPLYFRHFEALNDEMKPTHAPADGWFCGPSAIPIEHVSGSHSKSASMAHLSHDSTSQSATLSVTITITKPGLEAGPLPSSPPPGAVISGDIACDDDVLGNDDCCFDEPGADEPFYDDVHRAQLRRRRATDGSTTRALSSAAPGQSLTRGSAIVSTAYIGQTDRAPFVEATRPWSIVIPTPVANSTRNDTRPPRRPSPPKIKKHELSPGGKAAIAATIPTAVVILFVVLIWRQYARPPISRQKPAGQEQGGYDLDGSQVGILRGVNSHPYETYARMRPSPVPHDSGNRPRQPVLASESDQYTPSESGEAADNEEGFGLHSDGSAGREAPGAPVGLAIPVPGRDQRDPIYFT